MVKHLAIELLSLDMLRVKPGCLGLFDSSGIELRKSQRTGLSGGCSNISFRVLAVECWCSVKVDYFLSYISMRKLLLITNFHCLNMP